MVVERKNRTWIKIARTILIDSGIPKSFWAKVVNITCYVRNRCLIRSILNKTPYELLKKKLSYFRAFRCKYFVLNNGKDDLGKFDTKSGERIIVGYSSTNIAYGIYNKRTFYVEESIHIIFDESGDMEKLTNIDDVDIEELIPIQRDDSTKKSIKEQVVDDIGNDANDK